MSRKDAYRRYLKTWTWARKRRAACTIHGKRCAKCGTTRGPFEVHHKRYSKWGTEDPQRDLEVVCKPCHENEHSGCALAVGLLLAVCALALLG
jgi:5-methylcytosine-specific restriction endonuclease McrA